MDARVADYKGRVEAFTQRLLGKYTTTLKQRTRSASPKELNDALWQTVTLSPLECLVLDSPLLQRLRGIDQLGVAHWVYPSARHSRLEHSIGALHQMQRVLLRAEQNGHGARIDREPDWDRTSNALRLAALLHDIGHGCMSHVSENALKAASLRLVSEIADHLQLDDEISLSEAAAYFMIGSPAFTEMFAAASVLAKHPPLPDQPLQWIGNAIVGKAVDDRYPLLHELITGPFDVDKLDYMPRDAMYCGVPVVVDIPRLVQKIRFRQFSKERVPDEILDQVSDKDVYWIQGIALSGARTLDELMLGRVLLFDKVYRHHKVRAAEAMVGQIFSALRTTLSVGLTATLEITDAQLLEFDRTVLAAALQVSISNEQWAGLTPAREIASMLRERRLFYRAYAFASTMPDDTFRDDPAQRAAVEELERQVKQPEGREQITKEISDQLALICRTLGGCYSNLPIALDPPGPKGSSGEIARAYLIDEDGNLRRFRDDSSESPSWSNAYLMTRDIGYVFADESLAALAFLATEAALWSRYGLRTPSSSAVYAKVAKKDLDRLRESLTRAGYYRGALHTLRAPPQRLSRGDIASKIKRIVANLASFEGAALIEQTPGLRSIRITSERVFAWLMQFDTDSEVEAALEMLAQIKMISRADVVSSLSAFIGANPDYANSYLCPLGGPKDSSSILTYFGHDAANLGCEVLSLNDALMASDNRPIIFLDDFIGSGNQSDAIAKGWFGKRGKIDEGHGAPLGELAQEAIKKRRLGFVFVAGEHRGKQVLEEALRTEGLNGLVHIQQANIPTINSFSKDFIDRCRAIGANLLVGYDSKDRDATWCADRALGYGNNGHLIAFPYNVPSQALTALWCAGQVDGRTWLPLLPRRKKR